MSSSPSLDVQQLLDRSPFSRYQWLIFGLCFVVVLLDGFDTAAIGYIAPSLIKDWGVNKLQLAPVLSAALFGLAGGALCAGPLADRLGRKKVLVVSVLLFGAGCLASGFSADLAQLTVLRFITGFGLGAAMPNAVTLMSEYCPSDRRATITNAMFCGFPLGAALGGFLASWMIPQFGWRSVLYAGGVAPLLLVLVMLPALPESVRHMVARGEAANRIRAVLLRINAAMARDAASFVMSEPASVTPQTTRGLRLVLSRPYALGSVALWLAYFMGLMIFYALINWMPLLFKDAGIDARTATLISAVFPLGGVGAVAAGWLMDRYNADRVIMAGYLCTAAAIWAIGQSTGQVGMLMAVVFVAGALMNTTQSSMPALAAAFYPTAGRATGVAWMLGIGRFGGIAGSFLVVELQRRQLGFEAVFAVVAVPGLLAAGAVALKQRVARAEAGASAAQETPPAPTEGRAAGAGSP
ncbi:aromatic acid/H+ symport family MFS transporter [Aquabacterium olei]|uniref:Aromatic acid/H+ symport family MFS transporter n=1 Tax=Aquabacterium olei TaxID=1296669 RepID=A0A2U8FU02_9BURK|nr:MFS transporter [Aquabacterium olei]AWI54500.1 aromatic acid/H+ symport family MFS transporter [Aquabacterium olei]